MKYITSTIITLSALISGFALVAFPALASAATITAASCSSTDVQTAQSAADRINRSIN